MPQDGKNNTLYEGVGIPRGILIRREMNYFEAYYFQTNIICIAILFVMYINFCNEVTVTTGIKYYKAEMLSIAFYCVLDMLAALFKNASFSGVRYVLYTVNTLYIMWPCVLAYIWGGFIRQRMKKYDITGDPFSVIIRVLLVAVSAATLTTPFTGFGFTLNETNAYMRGVGAYIVPLVCYAYLLYITVKVFWVSRKNEVYAVKREFTTLIAYSIPVFICSALQILMYGTTLSQVGFTFGFFIVYLQIQESRISRDSLTGICNRREIDRYFDTFSHNKYNVLASMIDIDGFKKINDEYGHKKGDEVLKTVADILQETVDSLPAFKNTCFLARFGGDEFVVFSKNYNGNMEKDLCDTIDRLVDDYNSKTSEPFTLSVSCGSASGVVSSGREAKLLLAKADDEMYKVKNLKKSEG